MEISVVTSFQQCILMIPISLQVTNVAAYSLSVQKGAN